MATNKNVTPEAVIAPETASAPDTAPVLETTVDQKQVEKETAKAAAAIRSEERVDIYIERAQGNDEPNLFVSVNGCNFILPKGQTSNVPKSVAREIERSRRAQRKYDQTVDQQKNAAESK